MPRSCLTDRDSASTVGCRDFELLIGHPDHRVERLGYDLMRPTKELFRLWSRCRDGTLTRRDFEHLMQPGRQEINSLLLRGVFSGNAKLQGMCRPLYDHRDWLWTFLDVEGVEPTNNASERALRPAVIWRKLSFGTQSARGSRFMETILTVVETCHRLRRNSFEHLTAAVTAHFAGQPAPSLLGGVWTVTLPPIRQDTHSLPAHSPASTTVKADRD